MYTLVDKEQDARPVATMYRIPRSEYGIQRTTSPAQLELSEVL